MSRFLQTPVSAILRSWVFHATDFSRLIISKNSYSITEYVIDIERLVNRICQNENIELLKMKLIDIIIDEDILVNCNVNLLNQNNPVAIALKYIKNIIVITFKFEKMNTNVTVYKTGKVSISKITDEDKDEIIRKIIQITC